VPFVGPANQGVLAIFQEGAQVSGTSVDGVYTTTVTVPALSAKGTFSIDRLIVADNAGNQLLLDRKELVSRGVPSSFEQVGDGDAAPPPEIQSLTFDRAAVDTSADAQTITLTARLTDDFSGVTVAYFQFFNRAGQVLVAPFYPSTLRSGTALDGIYVGTLNMPRYSAPGTWYVDTASVYDQAGNTRVQTGSDLAARGMTNSFEQTGTGDTTPPTLQDLSWTPTAINTANAAQQITITARITDNLAGLRPDYWRPIINFYSPSGNYLFVYLNQQTAGTALDGTVTGVLTVPAFSESGVWTLTSMTVPDAVGNGHVYYTTDLAAQGLPTTFTNN
jgi:large repetitive protein